MTKSLHIRDWCAERAREKELAEKKAKERRRAAAYGAVMALSIVAVAYFGMRNPPAPTAPKEIMIEGARAAIDPNHTGDGTRWGLWIDATRIAYSKWSTALGHSAIDGDMKLIADSSACGPEAIACADRARMTIYVAQDGANVDRTTVMMHEIGHLLGVPHIEGDDLMNAKYVKGLEAPTPASVALANQEKMIWVIR